MLQGDSVSGHLKGFFSVVWNAFIYMLEHSYVSLTGALLLLIAAILFVPSKLSRKKRAMIGVIHVSAHLAAALVLMLLMELGVETCIRHNLLATSGEVLYEYCFVLHVLVAFSSTKFHDVHTAHPKIEKRKKKKVV